MRNIDTLPSPAGGFSNQDMVNNTQTSVQSINSNCVSCGGVRDIGDRCKYCGALYPEVISNQAPGKKLLSLGSMYRVKRFGDAVEITWRWWRPAHTFDTHGIEQVFVSKGQRSSKKSTWNVPVLQLVTTDGERHELMKGNAEVEFSDYESLRLTVLDALGIAPTAVHGAVDL